jgi:biotin transporter BioY
VSQTVALRPAPNGRPWLAVSLGLDFTQTLKAGLCPLLLGGAIKAAIATAPLSSAWHLASRIGR